MWKKYIEYLKTWAEDHSDDAYMGCCPACFDEWEDNEAEEEQED